MSAPLPSRPGESVPAAQAGATPSVSSAAPNESPVDPNKLTPEEQLALFEKDLKENDWGHQPC